MRGDEVTVEGVEAGGEASGLVSGPSNKPERSSASFRPRPRPRSRDSVRWSRGRRSLWSRLLHITEPRHHRVCAWSVSEANQKAGPQGTPPVAVGPRRRGCPRPSRALTMRPSRNPAVLVESSATGPPWTIRCPTGRWLLPRPDKSLLPRVLPFAAPHRPTSSRRLATVPAQPASHSIHGPTESGPSDIGRRPDPGSQARVGARPASRPASSASFHGRPRHGPPSHLRRLHD